MSPATYSKKTSMVAATRCLLSWVDSRATRQLSTTASQERPAGRGRGRACRGSAGRAPAWTPRPARRCRPSRRRGSPGRRTPPAPSRAAARGVPGAGAGPRAGGTGRRSPQCSRSASLLAGRTRRGPADGDASHYAGACAARRGNMDTTGAFSATPRPHRPRSNRVLPTPGGARIRADHRRGTPLQPAPDHPRRRDDRAEAAEERQGAGHRRRRPRQPGAALPRRGRRRHPRHRGVRRGRRVQPAAPDHPRPVGHREVEGPVGQGVRRSRPTRTSRWCCTRSASTTTT